MNAKLIINKSLIYLIIISSILLFYSKIDIISENGFVSLYNIRFVLLGVAALFENTLIIILMLVLYLLMELAMVFLLIPITKIYKVRVISSYVIRTLCVFEIVMGIWGIFSSGIGEFSSLLMSIILFCCLSYEFKSNKVKNKNEYITVNYDDLSSVTR